MSDFTLRLSAPHQRQHRRVGRFLQRRRDIGMTRQELFGLGEAAGTDHGSQPVHLVAVETDEVGSDRIVLLADTNDLLELAAEGFGVAVGGQAHDLRGVIAREAEIAAHDLPQEAERVRIVEGFDRRNPRALGLCELGAGRLADAVDVEDGRAIEAGRKIGGSRMRQMVRHEMEFLRELPSEKLLGHALHLAEPQQEGLLPLRKPPFGIEPRAAQLRIEGVGDVIDVVGGEPGMFQAPADRALGKLMRIVEMRFLGVLDAVEALLLDGGDELAVDQQRRRGLMIHRVDSENVHRVPSTLLRTAAD